VTPAPSLGRANVRILQHCEGPALLSCPYSSKFLEERLAGESLEGRPATLPMLQERSRRHRL
jgi:hypothetical protein